MAVSSSQSQQSPAPAPHLHLLGSGETVSQSTRAAAPSRLSLRRHLEYLSDIFEPGQHFSVIAPTGRGGKTYFVTRALLPFFEDFRVAFFDVKDYDATVTPGKGKGRSIFKHNRRAFPSKADVYWAQKPKHFRIHVKSGLAGTPLREQQRIIYEGLAAAYKQRDWVIVCDEMKFLCDYEGGLRLYPQLRDIWTRGRSSVTLVAMTQYPARVPTEMYHQPTHLYLGRLNSEGNKRLGEIAGTVDYKAVRAALAGVKKHQFLYVDQSADEPEQAMHITGI